MPDIRSIPGWAEMTGEELFQFCQSHPETAIPIPAQSLRNWFADNRFAWLNTNNAWVGPLVDAIASAPDQAAAGMERLFSHLSFPGSQVVDTDKDSHAGLLLFVMYVLQPTAEQLSAFYSEANGRKYPLFESAEQAEQVRDAELALIAFNESQKAAKETLRVAISQADAARFASEQAGQFGPECNAAWLAKINEVLG